MPSGCSPPSPASPRSTRREGRWQLTAAHDVRDDVQRRCSSAGGSLTHLAREGADLDAIYHRWFRTDEEASGPVTGPPVEVPS